MRALCIMLVAFTCQGLSAQTGDLPDTIVNRFLFADTLATVPLVGEAAEQFRGPLGLDESDIVSIRPIQMDSSKAAFAVSFTEGEPHDLYLHLEYEDDLWSIVAFRTLWLPGFVYALRDWLIEWDSLNGNPEREMIMRERLSESLEDILIDVSAEEIENTLNDLDSLLIDLPNLLLTTASDTDLKAHFLLNQVDFERITFLFATDSTLSTVRTSTDEILEGAQIEIAALLDSLHLQSASRGAVRSNFYRDQAVVVLTVGGMIDNSVGFLFVPEGSLPPPISPNRYIYLEEILPGWYIFKTT